MALRELPAYKEYEAELHRNVSSGKISKKAVKDFLKKYFEGDPECVGCPTGCKEPNQCYIDIHLNLFGDDGKRRKFGTRYVRDDHSHCCGKVLEELESREYCTICGNEY